MTVTAQEPLSGWEVAMDLPAGASINSLMNGQNSGTTGSVTVSDAGYNAELAAASRRASASSAPGQAVTRP